MTVVLPLAEWQRLGVRLPGGAALPGDGAGGLARLRDDAALPRLSQL